MSSSSLLPKRLESSSSSFNSDGSGCMLSCTWAFFVEGSALRLNDWIECTWAGRALFAVVTRALNCVSVVLGLLLSRRFACGVPMRVIPNGVSVAIMSLFC